jgi:Calcineurin-like phosphoesterase/Purple acid Phosphatase, N-terminal domain
LNSVGKLLVLAISVLNLASNLGGGNAVVIAPRNCGGAVKHVTIAVGPDPPTSMIVTFASIPSTFHAPVGGVLVGTSPSELDRLVLEEEPPTHYSLNSPHHGSSAPYHSPYYHHVTINNLQPNTNYYYKPVVQANVKAFDKYNLQLRKPPAASASAAAASSSYREEASEASQSEKQPSKDGEETAQSEEELLLHDFEEAVEDDVMDSAHRFLMESGPYDGSAKQCPSPDKIRSFRTAPVPGNETVVNLAICGDVGQFPHSEELVARMLRSRDDIDVLILAGDVAYASLDHRRWDTFLDFLDDYPISERVPVMLVPGNHDIEKQENDTEMFMAYENRFRMPRMHPPVMEKYDGPPGLFNMDHPPYPLPYEWGNGYYAFTYGPARVIMINAYASMEANSTQYRWIESELRAVDRTVTPWVLTVLHPPIYNTFSLHQRDPQIVAAKTNLEPLFVEHRVNMVFTGTLSHLLRRP